MAAIPKESRIACEIDLATLELREAPFARTGESASVVV
jgi:hypothetical protein